MAAPAAAHAAGEAPTAPRGGRAPSPNGGERERRRLPPEDFRCRDGRHRHRLDLHIGAPLISVDLQEHVADAQRHAIVVGKDDLDPIHLRHLRTGAFRIEELRLLSYARRASHAVRPPLTDRATIGIAIVKILPPPSAGAAMTLPPCASATWCERSPGRDRSRASGAHRRHGRSDRRCAGDRPARCRCRSREPSTSRRPRSPRPGLLAHSISSRCRSGSRPPVQQVVLGAVDNGCFQVSDDLAARPASRRFDNARDDPVEPDRLLRAWLQVAARECNQFVDQPAHLGELLERRVQAGVACHCVAVGMEADRLDLSSGCRKWRAQLV